MARYEHLPIYKAAMDLAIHFEKVVAGFSRYHKYTLGTELRNSSRGVVSLITQANSAQEKGAKLEALRVHLDELLILIRLAKEVKAFKSFSAYQFTVEQVGSICRQNEGWLRSVSNGQGKGRQRGPESSRRRVRPSRRERAE
ncbi:MAG: four helix bundle protein [Sedimenticola sp.]